MKKDDYDMLVMERERLKRVLGEVGGSKYKPAIEQRLNIVRERISEAHREQNHERANKVK